MAKNKEPPMPKSGGIAMACGIALIVGMIGTPYLDRQVQKGHPLLIPPIDRKLRPQKQRHVVEKPHRVKPKHAVRKKQYTFKDYFTGWEKPLYGFTFRKHRPWGYEVGPATNTFRRIPGGRGFQGGVPGPGGFAVQGAVPGSGGRPFRGGRPGLGGYARRGGFPHTAGFGRDAGSPRTDGFGRDAGYVRDVGHGSYPGHSVNPGTGWQANPRTTGYGTDIAHPAVIGCPFHYSGC